MIILRFMAAGPLAAFLGYALGMGPLGLDQDQSLLLGVIAWCIGLWCHGALPLGVTALTGSILASLMGLAPWEKIILSYAHPVIFLFMGGLFIARGMEVTGLDRRFAISAVAHPWCNGSPRRSVVMIALAAFLLSMWLSNVATTAIFLPIALGLMKEMDIGEKDPRNVVLLLICHAASIGGIATPVGTAPNLITLGLLKEVWGTSISFGQWVVWMAPLSVLLFGALLLVFWKDLSKLPAVALQCHASPPPLVRAQKLTLGAFAGTAFLWVAPALLDLINPDWGNSAIKFFPESLVAMLGGLSLFALRADNRPILTWTEAREIDWDSLMLFGGGLALGELMFQKGLATRAAHVLGMMADNPWALGFVAILLTMLLTEFASNTATVNLVLPVILASAFFKEMGLGPVLMVSMAANTAFMMPVGTPPSAMVFGTGRITLRAMVSRGAWLNLASVIIVYLYCMLAL